MRTLQRLVSLVLSLAAACGGPAADLADPCGDGDVGTGEACDDGVNDGRYGGCQPGCVERAPFCGDGVVDDPEEACDDGINDGAWGSCQPDCAGPAGFCGDGVVSGPEACDDAVNEGGYGGCRPGCLARAAHCGDGVVNGPEACDDGVNDGACGSCATDCSGEVTAPFLTSVTVREADGYGFPADLTPDLYLEILDDDGALVALTLTFTDVEPPVVFDLDGVRADRGALRVKVWDEDGGAFGDADLLGTFRFDPAFGSDGARDGGTRITWEVEDLPCD